MSQVTIETKEELKQALKLLVKPEFYELNVRAVEYY